MPDTYRCRACEALYLDSYPPHVCARLEAPAPHLWRLIPGARDENLVQLQVGGRPHMKNPGKGRTLVARGDALTGATPAAIAALQQAPAIGPDPTPDLPLPWPEDPAMVWGAE